MTSIVGVDVGGTFTDFFLRDEATGEIHLHKVPSTPDDPSRAILEGLRHLAARLGPGAAIGFLAHGTTVATNALIQRRGGRVTLVTTIGFRDLLEIGRQTRPKIYDLKADHPEPLVPRERRLEVAERIGPAGEVVTPLGEDEVARVVEAALATDPDSVAVCLLFSFLNPMHEQRIGRALKSRRPELDVSLSCEVQPEFREYERLSTTVINAFLQPEVGRYMARLQHSFAALAPGGRIGICQSSGGLMSIARATAMPIRTALSGPAAGVVGAIAVAARAGLPDVVTFDMGGTSTDVCLIRGGQAETSFGRSVAGFPVRLPAIDIHTVGAGGGSIAAIDRDGLMKVGPQSAGAVPGPACYGRGGLLPTVSDANLVLGRLPAELVGGGMRLDAEKARAAVERLAGEIGLPPIETALGIIRIVNSNMVRAIRAVSVERGHDPRECVLMPFGGAGALHAVEMAAELGMRRIIVPPAPGILCAEGVAVSGLEESFVATCRTPLGADLTAPASDLARLVAAAHEWFEAETVPPDARRTSITLDMRYIGQNYELPITVDESSAGLPSQAMLRQAFFAAHDTRHGHHDPNAPVEIVNIRLVARAEPEITRAPRPAAATRAESAGPRARSDVWFGIGAPVSARIVPREDLRPGDKLAGPAIITQFDATTLLPPTARLIVEPAGSLLIEVTP